METFVKAQGSAKTLWTGSVHTVMTSWLTFAVAVLSMTPLVAAKNIYLVLTIHDANGFPVPKFEAMLHTYEEGYTGWQSGKDGRIHFGHADTQTLYIRDDSQFQVIVRAPELAPAILHLEGSLYMERTVTLTPGRLIELSVTTADGRPIPKDVIPLVVFTDFADRVRSTRQPENIRPGHVFDFEMSKVRRVGDGRYQFRIPDEVPPFFLTIDHPGFMRSIESKVINEDELADGRIEWQLPAPARLRIQLDVPSTDDRRRYDFSSVGVASKVADVAPYYTVWLQRYDSLGFDVTLDDLPPNHYGLVLRLISSKQEGLAGRTSEIPLYWDRMKFDLTAGEQKTINLSYVPFDPNSWRGNSTATVTVKHYGGKPAAGSSYTLTYAVPHYDAVVVKQGELDAAGRFHLEDVRPGPAGPEFFLKVGDEWLGRMRMTKKGSQNFEFTLAPKVEDRAPEVTFVDAQTGGSIPLRSLLGKVVYLEFWATWCGPCQTPMAKLNAVMKKRQADWDKRVEVLAISIDDSQEFAYRYVKQRGWIHVHHLWTGEDGHTGFESPAAKKFGVTGVPTAILIDPRGVIVWRGHPIENDSEAQIDALLRTIRTEL
jgi:thiol-disulfide isomerase/thioredoxin